MLFILFIEVFTLSSSSPPLYAFPDTFRPRWPWFRSVVTRQVSQLSPFCFLQSTNSWRISWRLYFSCHLPWLRCRLMNCWLHLWFRWRWWRVWWLHCWCTFRNIWIIPKRSLITFVAFLLVGPQLPSHKILRRPFSLPSRWLRLSCHTQPV